MPEAMCARSLILSLSLSPLSLHTCARRHTKEKSTRRRDPQLRIPGRVIRLYFNTVPEALASTCTRDRLFVPSPSGLTLGTFLTSSSLSFIICKVGISISIQRIIVRVH